MMANTGGFMQDREQANGVPAMRYPSPWHVFFLLVAFIAMIFVTTIRLNDIEAKIDDATRKLSETTK